MSNQSDAYGRAYEYACLIGLYRYISAYRPCEIVKNDNYQYDLEKWNEMSNETQEIMCFSASSAIKRLDCLEPNICDKKTAEVLTLSLQADSRGEEGDVRDILLSIESIGWEIGLSIKHNHFAVKHSRLAKTLDFGHRWFGNPCSNTYWDAISSIFEYLNECSASQEKWSDLEDKASDVYVPLLTAFINEIKHQCEIDPQTPKKMVEYLLGEFDFYKIISLDSKHTTLIESFNLHGTLNKPSPTKVPEIQIPIVDLPTRIYEIGFKENSQNTVEMIMNNGWQFNFRIHNASTYVETSLKFDIQIIGLPASIICIECPWED